VESEPNKVQVLGQLDKIVSSEGFVSSPRMRKFLRYIVEKTLDGQSASLKGYTIGVDVFERGDNFDPQADTIVRVQARNLRRALRLYNLTTGVDDLVKIDLVKGNYVPRFSFNEQHANLPIGDGGQLSASSTVETKTSHSATASPPEKPSKRPWGILAFILLIFVLGVLFGLNA